MMVNFLFFLEDTLCKHCLTELENHTEVILQHCKMCRSDVRSKVTSRYICFKCDYETPYSVTMRRHIRAHIGDRPHICEYCNYRSNQRANLLSHVKFKHSDDHVRKKSRPRYLLTEDGIQETTTEKPFYKEISFRAVIRRGNCTEKNIKKISQKSDFSSKFSDQ